MSFTRLTSLAERLGSRRSLDLPSDIQTPRQKQGDDFVLVGGSLPDSESNQENVGSEDDQASLKSPEPVSLHLNVPSEGDSSSQGKAVHLNLDINDETLLPSWKDHSPVSDDESMAHDADTTAATDCTDYSGLGDAAAEKDRNLNEVLAEVNQRHEWAMEAVIRGWETEKADLLSKLEKTTEAHDYLEAELKHREDNFAGLLDSMLDQKLDQMLQLLQESGVSPQTPTSTRASFSSPSGPNTSPSQQPTVRKATKVVNDLESIMEAMKNQHAELQSAILQLLPEDLDEEDRQRITSRIDAQRFNRKRRLNPVRASLRRVGDAFNGSKTYAREKVPRLVRAGGSVAGRTVRVPARFTRRVARQVTHYCHSKGLRNEHLTAFAGILTGILVSSLIVKSAGRKERQVTAKEEPVIEQQGKAEVIDFTKEEAEECKPDSAETCGECMHIIFSGNGIYKRTTYDSSPSLMFAWPKIVLDYK